MSKTCTSCGTTYSDDMVFCPKDGTSLRLDESQGDLIGSVIAERYEVKKLLGEGGMGKVYLAKHVRLPQQAAIKVLHHDMVKDTGAVARFNREAANAAQIEHDRVARVFDFGETSDGLWYIAMEYVPGLTLRGLLDDEKRLSPVRAANLTYQVAEGLEAAHRLRIVHRDLKPDNILVITDDAGVDRSKVVDFGIAKATSGSETQLTQVGMLVGTPDYMSPEQVLGEQLDGRSDLYALALVAYEMFTGDLPFEGSTPERKLTARLIQDPRPLAVVAPDVAWPAALQEAFDRALIREPENRTPTVMEFADAIVNAVEAWTGMSVLRARTPLSNTAILSAANESTGVMNKPTPMSTPTITPAAPAVVAASAKTPAPSTKSATPGASTSASKLAIPEPTPKKSPMAAIAAAVVVIAAVGGYAMFGRGDSANANTPANTPAVPPASEAPTVAATVPSTTAPSSGAAAPPNAPAPAPASAPGSDAKVTKPVAAATPATPAPPPATTVAAPSSSGASPAEAAESRRALNGLRSMLSSAPDGEDAAVANKAIPQIMQIFPRLGSATDSAWAYLALVSAYGMADHPEKSCEPFRNAKRLANTSQLRDAVEQIRGALTCAP